MKKHIKVSPFVIKSMGITPAGTAHNHEVMEGWEALRPKIIPVGSESFVPVGTELPKHFTGVLATQEEEMQIFKSKLREFTAENLPEGRGFEASGEFTPPLYEIGGNYGVPHLSIRP